MVSGEQESLGARRIDRPTWLAYLAGYLDGEGCFSADDGRLRVSISNCFPWLLVAFKEEFGGSISRKGHYSDNHRASYQWQAYGESALNCCEAVLPYLVEKRPQAVLLIEYCKWPPRSSQREAISRQMKKLKRTNYA
jgi:hypothetical protein